MCPAFDLAVDFSGFPFLKFLQRGLNTASEKSNWEGFTSCAWEEEGSTPVAGNLSIDRSGPIWSKTLERPKCRRVENKKTLGDLVQLLIILIN